MANVLSKAQGEIELGNPYDSGMGELSAILAALSRSAQSGDVEQFRKYLRQLMAAIEGTRLVSTGTDYGALLDESIFGKKDVSNASGRAGVSKSTHDKTLNLLGAADLLTQAAFGVISKAVSEDDYVSTGTMSDALVAMTMTTTAEEISKSCGVDIVEAATVAELSMGQSAPGGRQAIHDAYDRYSASKSRAYWSGMWGKRNG